VGIVVIGVCSTPLIVSVIEVTPAGVGTLMLSANRVTIIPLVGM